MTTAGQTIIQLPEQADAPLDWYQETNSGEGRVGSSPFDELLPQLTGQRVSLIAPRRAVLLTQAQAPTQNRKRLLQAIPFALEEQLIEDVDQLHFALGAEVKDGQVAVAVIARDLMETWLQRFRDAGIEIQALLPAPLCLPATETGWQVAIAADEALVRLGPYAGCHLDRTNLLPYLQLALSQTEQPPAQIRLHGLEGETLAEAQSWSESLEVPVQLDSSPQPLIAELGRHFRPQESINLLQGAYSRREQLGRLWRPWQAAAALLFGWAVIQTGLVYAELSALEREQRQLREEMVQIYRDAFPEAKNVVDPKLQMQRKLQSLQGGGDSGGFLALLHQVGQAIQAEQGISLEGVNYREGRLDLELQASDLQRLDALKQALEAQAGLSATIQGANAKGDSVTARMRISGGEQ